MEDQREAVTIVHTGVGVVLMPVSIEPGSINPDFLRYNGISDPDWKVEGPVTVEAGFSRVAYNNGVVVTATRDHVAFVQTGQPLDLEDVVGPSMATRYLSSVARPLAYEVIAIDPRGLVRVPESRSPAAPTLFGTLSSRLRFEDTLPGLQARASYELDDRSITVYVAESPDEQGNAVSELRFSAHIHRDVPRSQPTEHNDFIVSVLDRWRRDIADFDRLANQIYLEFLTGG